MTGHPVSESSGSAVAADQVVDALARVLGDGTLVTPDSGLGDLGVDSIVLAELIAELEALSARLLEFRPVGRLVTVADLARAVTFAG